MRICTILMQDTDLFHCLKGIIYLFLLCSAYTEVFSVLGVKCSHFTCCRRVFLQLSMGDCGMFMQ